MRLIDSDALRKESKMLYSIHNFEPVEGYTQDQIDNAPTIEPVRLGGWIFATDYTSICSLCGKEAHVDHEDEYKYCPNCGANMKAEQAKGDVEG